MLKKISGIQGSGTVTGQFEIQILIDFNRDITEDENWEIGDYARKIIAMLSSNNVANDPKTKLEVTEAKAKFKAMFGNGAIFIEEIPNGYSPDSTYFKHFPWYKITTRLGHFKIGWRKRVIEIDWSETTIAQKAQELFRDEDVTKEAKLIHAWGYDKATEYIEKLMNVTSVLAVPK